MSGRTRAAPPGGTSGDTGSTTSAQTIAAGRTVRALRLRPRTATGIAAASMLGVVAFGWPLLADPGSAAVAHAGDAPWLFVLLLPLVLLVVLGELGSGGMDAKAVAVLGVLAAVIAALRPLGAGTAGLEPIWVVLVLGGRVLGPGFGFALGAVSLFASALLTGGVGPWLPFQMIAAAWVALGAGLLPPLRGRAEIAMLAAYGAVASFLYGIALNLWFWPFAAGLSTSLSFVPGDPAGENVLRWLAFSLATSVGYDLTRAILTAVLVIVAGPAVLLALRRVTRRAAFEAPVRFVPAADAAREG